MACSDIVNQIKTNESEKDDDSTERMKLKRPYPFPSEGEESLSDEIVPEAVDVLDAIFAALCPFSEDSSTSNTSIIENTNNASFTIKDTEEIKSDDEIIDDNNDCRANFSVEGENQTETINEPFEDIYDFKNIPLQVTGAWKEFGIGDNYTRGCKWAPDGSCILTCSDDNILRLFNLPQELWDFTKWQDMPEMEAVVKIPEGDLIYDYCWYPLMNSAEPDTCCLASCSKNTPVHLWDGFTGKLRCSYRCYDQMDEVTAARSLSFDADGSRIFCGFDKTIRIFNVDLPGRNFETRQTFAKKSGQPGIISCFAFTRQNRNISAVGSYQKSIGIYSEPDGELECLLEGQKGGLTQLQFSPDGNLLYSGGRKDSEILCWDLRYLGEVLFCLRRSCVTNQRLYFDISRCGRYVVSGNNNGIISVWDTYNETVESEYNKFRILKPIQFFLGHNDCVNGISLHPTYPFLCSSSGQRKFQDLLSDDEDGMFTSKSIQRDNSLRLWWVGKGG
ncbi:telomerase Cajal body protein 1 [Nephila pilipes]|uniref:WD repeat-containing protein 79 n=1 Tax=Nephila pilipes TaxID=299642 RepID=A0A8X6QXK1_NEPPI|nr:telomerase Cajal body protein 1 [Nephila pilipes]